MSDEHTQHCQCQVCFVSFPTNQELLDHIEEYRVSTPQPHIALLTNQFRERLLVAELERCRMHIAQSYNINDRNDADDDCNREDDDYEPAAQSGPLQCPFGGCERKEPFTTRGNLVRHFQKHIQCYEMCPFCHEIIRQVHRFIRHDCKAYRDKPKETYMQCRIAQLNRMVSKELYRLQSLQSHTRKRAGGVAGKGSMQARKMVKMTQSSVLLANTSLQAHVSVDRSIATDSELACSSKTIKTAATNNNEWTFAKTAAMMASNNAELFFPSETAIGMPTADSGWAFAETIPVMSTDDGGWAFAETTQVMPTNDDRWAFAKTTQVMPTNDGEWAFAETTQVMPTNDGGWAFAETAKSITNDSEGRFAANIATNGNLVYSSERNSHDNGQQMGETAQVS